MSATLIVICGVIILTGIACAVGVVAGLIERGLEEEYDEDEPYRKKHYIETRKGWSDEDYRDR